MKKSFIKTPVMLQHVINFAKPIASILIIAIFMIFAIATEKESTNTKVRNKECEPEPAVTESLQINVTALRVSGLPIVGAQGTIFLVFQAIQDTSNCTSLIVSQQNIPFTTTANGTFIYHTSPQTRANKADLWRAEVYIPTGPDYIGFRMTQVAPYGFTILYFNYTDPPDL